MLINGQARTTIDAMDRGLLYGDGVFETIAVQDGVPLLWVEHMTRLQEGCERLRISAPDVAVLHHEVCTVCAGSGRAVAKIIVTRGIGGRGYSSVGAEVPTRIVHRHPWPEYPITHQRDGVGVHVCQTRLSTQPLLAGMKHLNRLEQVMARAEWNDARLAEGLLCDQQGHVIEGVMSNLFMVRETQLWTPPLTQCGVAGVMRGWLLARAQEQGRAAQQKYFSLSTLQQAAEVFLCNSLIGIWPVRAIGDHVLPSERPVTRYWQARIAAELGL